MSEIQARVKVPRGIFVHSVMIKNQQFHRRKGRTKLMNFCLTHYVLYCFLFVISFRRAYPLPLEYLLPSICHSNKALVKNTKSYYCTTLTLCHHYTPSLK